MMFSKRIEQIKQIPSTPGLQTVDWKEKVFLHSWHPYAWIIAIGFILYSQALFFNFSFFDDNRLIIDRYYHLSQLSNIGEAFKQDMSLLSIGGYYRPLLTLSFIADVQLSNLLGFSGPNPFIFHATNVLLHLIASILVFILLMRLNYRKELSLLFSLIFTVHPALTHAVCWIPGRNDSLLAVFMIPTFIFLLKFIESKQWKSYFWHILFFTFSIFTKEVAFIFIPIAFLYLHIIIREKLFSLNKIYLSAGWIFSIIIWLLARQSPVGANTVDKINFSLTDLTAIFIYIGKILLPFNLAVVPILKNSDIAIGCGFITLALIIIAFLISKNKQTNLIIFGASWFILFLIPSFINTSLSVVSFFMEHRIYLPIIGFFIIILEIDFIKNLDISKKITAAICAAIVIIFSSLTVIHSLDYRDKYSFWESAVKTSPDAPFVHVNLGHAYHTDGKLDLAEKECKKALELDSQQPLAHNILGLIYTSKNMYKEAEQEFDQELIINRSPDKVLPNLGALYYRMKEFKKAEEVWKDLVKLNPLDPVAYHNLGILYMDMNKFTEAEEAFKNDLARNPICTIALFNLGLLYYDHGLPDKAEQLWKQTLQVNPKEQMIHNNLGLLYIKKKMYSEAEKEFKLEISTSQQPSRAFFNLGLLYQQQGKFAEMEQCWVKAIEINPNDIGVYKKLIQYYNEQKLYEKSKHYIDLLQKRGVEVPSDIIKDSLPR